MPELRFPISEDDHVIGRADAPVTFVEYGDYQCPHCQAAQPVVAGLIRHYARDLRFAYRHFPLVTIHAFAKPAAESAEYAGSRGRFWEMHEALFANGQRLSVPTLLLLADQLGLGAAALREALASGRFAPKVEHDFATGVRSGVNGTPCFFINGRRFEGAHDAMTLAAAIDSALEKALAAGPRVRA
jgi:protein-disulfide isomerase